MTAPTYDGPRALARLAAGLKAANAPASPVPALIWLTDPARTPDILDAARGLPPGTGIILRHFGEAGQIALAGELAACARSQGLVLLVGADPYLAAAIGAHGVHWPHARLGEARRWRMRRPDWIVTASAHSARELTRAAGLADAALLSPIFASRSPSAGRPLGALRAAGLARSTKLPVIALGGVTARRAKRLKMIGFSGLAAVDALSAQPAS